MRKGDRETGPLFFSESAWYNQHITHHVTHQNSPNTAKNNHEKGLLTKKQGDFGE